MTRSYSNDLREKVIEYIKEGKSYHEAGVIFRISISSIGRWHRKYKQEGNYIAKQRGHCLGTVDYK